MLIFSLDIGGSSIKYAVLETEGYSATILQHEQPIQLISLSFDDLKAQVVEIVNSALSNNHFIKSVAISTTGGVDESGVVINAGHFQGYSNISWDEILKKSNGKIENVFVVNDGKASCWAEYSSINKKIHCFVHFVVGTGIGGSIIIDDKIFTGDSNYAGYLGHVKITEEITPQCSCGNYGCVETLASAQAIIRYYDSNNSNEKNDNSSLRDIIVMADNGNEEAINALKFTGKKLGIAIGNIMNILNPAIITIGGGVVIAADEIGKKGENIYVDAAIATAMEKAHKRVAATTKIQRAKLGNNGGLIGAAILAVRFINKMKVY